MNITYQSKRIYNIELTPEEANELVKYINVITSTNVVITPDYRREAKQYMENLAYHLAKLLIAE